jgi:16S rRNA (guanine966-N2)-methyltransferase
MGRDARWQEAPAQGRWQPHNDLRPTAARVRDALFNSLGSLVTGATVLDLFAGTGGLGIEALRRGARRAVFVELDATRARGIRRALQRAGLDDLAAVRREDALAAVDGLAKAGEVFDLVLLDPPYGRGWLTRALAAIAASGLLSTRGTVAAEGHWRDRPDLPEGFIVAREARYGETVLWFVRRQDEP